MKSPKVFIEDQESNLDPSIDNAEFAAGPVLACGLLAEERARERAELDRQAPRLALAKVVELRRRQLGLSVEALAQKASVPPGAVSQAERYGHLPIRTDWRRAILQALQLPANSVQALMEGICSPAAAATDLSRKFLDKVKPAGTLTCQEQVGLDEFLAILETQAPTSKSAIGSNGKLPTHE